ncbi:MAG: hypothetical protein E7315_02765 [Clostridiales bacterium]|nr:hypothetical protein [Clostridiales bacterium]
MEHKKQHQQNYISNAMYAYSYSYANNTVHIDISSPDSLVYGIDFCDIFYIGNNNQTMEKIPFSIIDTNLENGVITVSGYSEKWSSKFVASMNKLGCMHIEYTLTNASDKDVDAASCALGFPFNSHIPCLLTVPGKLFNTELSYTDNDEKYADGEQLYLFSPDELIAPVIHFEFPFKNKFNGVTLIHSDLSVLSQEENKAVPINDTLLSVNHKDERYYFLVNNNSPINIKRGESVKFSVYLAFSRSNSKGLTFTNIDNEVSQIYTREQSNPYGYKKPIAVSCDVISKLFNKTVLYSGYTTRSTNNSPLYLPFMAENFKIAWCDSLYSFSNNTKDGIERASALIDFFAHTSDATSPGLHYTHYDIDTSNWYSKNDSIAVSSYARAMAMFIELTILYKNHSQEIPQLWTDVINNAGAFVLKHVQKKKNVLPYAFSPDGYPDDEASAPSFLGMLYLLIKFYRLTKNEEYLKLAKRNVNTVYEHMLDEYFADSIYDSLFVRSMLELYHVTKDTTYIEYACVITDKILMHTPVYRPDDTFLFRNVFPAYEISELGRITKNEYYTLRATMLMNFFGEFIVTKLSSIKELDDTIMPMHTLSSMTEQLLLFITRETEY